MYDHHALYEGETRFVDDSYEVIIFQGWNVAGIRAKNSYPSGQFSRSRWSVATAAIPS